MVGETDGRGARDGHEPRLARWLRLLRANAWEHPYGSQQDWWAGVVVPQFVAACREAVHGDGADEALEAWQAWLGNDEGRYALPALAGDAAPWQTWWLPRLLALALHIAAGGQWTPHALGIAGPGDLPLPATLASLDGLPGGAAALPPAFWRDLARRITPARDEAPDPSGLSETRAVLFPLYVRVGQRPSLLARFRLERLSGGDGQVFLAPEQALARSLQDEFAATFRHAGELARRLLEAERERGPSAPGAAASDVRVWIEAETPGTPGHELLLASQPLDGASAGGALLLGLWSLWGGVPLEAGLVVSFQLHDRETGALDGACHPIDAVMDKAAACLEHGCWRLLLARAQQEAIEPWAAPRGLHVLGAASLRQAAEEASGLAAGLQAYYQALVERLAPTDWRHHDGRPVRLVEIDIPIRVLKEEPRPPRDPARPGADAAPSAREERDSAEPEEPALRYMDPEVARLYEEPTLERRQREVPRETEWKTPERAVLLGAPGGGKTFLTRWTAVQLAKQGLADLADGKPLEALPLPIHLNLSDLAAVALPRDGVTPPQRALAAQVLSELAGATAWQRLGEPTRARFRQWLEARLDGASCWLVLDALDQVSEQAHGQVQAWLEVFGGWQCRQLVTCRTFNYEGLRHRLPGQAPPTYELAPFRPSDVRAFAGRWFGEGSERAAALRAVLERSYPLAHACRVPLVATLACLVHEEQPLEDPIRRRDLYARALRLLLRRGWEREGKTLEPQVQEDVVLVLERLALGLLLRANVNLFSHREVLGGLRAALAAEPGLKLSAAGLRGDLVSAGLPALAGNDERASVQYSFLHRSFLEYLSACRVAACAKQRGWRAIAELVDRKAWDPAWWECLVFLAAELDRAAPLLQVVADQRKDDYFRHRLALAARCLGEIDFERASHDLRTLRDEITASTFQIVWERAIGAIPTVTTMHERALPALVQAEGCYQQQPLLHWLSRTARGGAGHQRAAATELLGALGAAAHPEVLPALLDCLLHDGDVGVRARAVEALGAMGVAAAAHSEVLPALLDHLLHDGDVGVCWKAAEALGALGVPAAAHSEVLPALLDRLRNDGNVGVRGRAAEVLRAMGEAAAAHSEVLPTLLDRLRNDRAADVRWRAAGALGALGEAAAAHPETLPTLLDRVGVCWRAAEVLGQLLAAGGRTFAVGEGRWRASIVSDLSALPAGWRDPCG
ncbi:MAG: HEAT repeat domain-containing protein [Chloroflexi bacterium]|nr:HEAT repeat domain-containing protein [Chloroflexota bacterium]